MYHIVILLDFSALCLVVARLRQSMWCEGGMAVPVWYLLGGPDSKRRPEHVWIQLSQTGTTEWHGSPSRHHSPRSWARPHRWLGQCAWLYLVSIRPPGSPKQGPTKSRSSIEKYASLEKKYAELETKTRAQKQKRGPKNKNAEPRNKYTSKEKLCVSKNENTRQQ